MNDQSVMCTEELVRRERAFTAQAYGSREVAPLVLVDAEGVEVIDARGHRFLDLTAQTASCAVGYRHPAMLTALRRQLDRAVVSPAHIHPGRVELAARLAEATEGALNHCWFGVTGSDAIDAAIMFARAKPGRWKIISHHNGYHGSTFGALSAHGIGPMRQPFEPLLPGFVKVMPPDGLHGYFPGTDDVTAAALAQLRHVILEEGPEQVAALLVEPIFAGGGVIVPPDDYLRGLRALCDEFGILLVFDEVVTGLGRTGDLFAYMHAGAVPDMLVLGKGLTSGYQALSAVLMRADSDPFVGRPDLPLHLHTMAANPMGCTAASTTLDILDREHLLKNARTRGAELIEGLRVVAAQLPIVADVRGRGLLIGIELSAEGINPKQLEQQAVLACRDQGVLVYGSSGPFPVLVLHPPLTLSAADVRRAIDALSAALDTLN